MVSRGILKSVLSWQGESWVRSTFKFILWYCDCQPVVTGWIVLSSSDTSSLFVVMFRSLINESQDLYSLVILEYSSVLQDIHQEVDIVNSTTKLLLHQILNIFDLTRCFEIKEYLVFYFQIMVLNSIQIFGNPFALSSGQMCVWHLHIILIGYYSRW